MLAKVFTKGQVVIPAEIRKLLHIEAGDYLEVKMNPDRECIELRRPDGLIADELAGSLSKYARGKNFPSHAEMRACLKKGLSREAAFD